MVDLDTFLYNFIRRLSIEHDKSRVAAKKHEMKQDFI